MFENCRKNDDDKNGQKTGFGMEFDRIFRSGTGGRKAGLGGGFAEARTLVRICSGFCVPNTPAAILRIGAADLKADASVAGPN